MEPTPKLNAALAVAQSEFRAVAFDSTNPFLKNKFASLGAVIASAKPILAKHGLSVTQQPTGSAGSIGVITTLRHSSGENVSSEIALPLGDEKGKSQAQLAGSIITYLRRYSLAGVLGLYADEDGDGHAPEPTKPAAQPIAQTKAASPKPTPTPVRQFTPEDREKFITALLAQGIEASDCQAFAESVGLILPTESADVDWPLDKIPATKQAMANLVKSIHDFTKKHDNIP